MLTRKRNREYISAKERSRTKAARLSDVKPSSTFSYCHQQLCYAIRPFFTDADAIAVLITDHASYDVYVRHPYVARTMMTIGSSIWVAGKLGDVPFPYNPVIHINRLAVRRYGKGFFYVFPKRTPIIELNLYEPEITKGMIPDTVTRLEIENPHHKIVPGSIPPSVTHVRMSHLGYNTFLPDTVQYLELNGFYRSVRLQKWPSVRSITYKHLWPTESTDVIGRMREVFPGATILMRCKQMSVLVEMDTTFDVSSFLNAYLTDVNFTIVESSSQTPALTTD